MPQLAPGESKTAIAPITVKPSGLSCEAELFLGPDEVTKVATSGKRPFSSTGVKQDISLPITMPSAEGAYHAYIDVYAGGLLIAAYQAIEDVVIVAPAPPEFVYVSDIKRKYYSASYDYFMVDVQNVGSVAGVCTLEFWTKHLYDRNGPVPTEWKLYTTVSHTLQPGEIGTFGHRKEC
ncbi:unnamed protein product, partial [marine sediment metagenome]